MLPLKHNSAGICGLAEVQQCRIFPLFWVFKVVCVENKKMIYDDWSCQSGRLRNPGKNRTSRAFRTPVVILITILLNLKIIIIKNLPWSWTLLSYLRFRMVWSWNIEASLRPDHGTNVRSKLIIIDFDLKINSQLFRKTGHKSRTLFWQVYRSMSSNFSGKTRRVGKMKKTSNLNSVRKMREREREDRKQREQYSGWERCMREREGGRKRGVIKMIERVRKR